MLLTDEMIAAFCHANVTVSDLEHIVKEWQWLLIYSCAIKSADALLHRQPFPQTFKLLNKEKIDSDLQSQAYVCRYLFVPAHFL